MDDEKLDLKQHENAEILAFEEKIALEFTQQFFAEQPGLDRGYPF